MEILFGFLRLSILNWGLSNVGQLNCNLLQALHLVSGGFAELDRAMGRVDRCSN